MKLTNYTHKNISIHDIRLKNGKKPGEKFFALIVDGIKDTLYINYEILNDRVKSYFLGRNIEQVDRKELLALKWNFVITQGYFYKIIDKNHFEVQHSNNKSKYFVSVIEIDGLFEGGMGELGLGSFSRSFGPVVNVYDDDGKNPHVVQK
jgi:hypothetical protein